MLTTESTLHNSNKERFVAINGKRFHHIWLRDNCLCPMCRESASFQRFFDISDLQEITSPLSVEVEEQNLIVEWDEQPSHRSTFPISWLMNRWDARESVKQEGSQRILWDRAWLETHRPKWHDYDSLDTNSWIDRFFTLGFTIIRNIGFEDLKSLIASVGPIHPLARYTDYSTVMAAKKSQTIEDLGVSPTGDALSPHTDMSYIDKPLTVLLLYGIANEASGGESVLVDGFRVAKDFQQAHPDYFEILARTSVEFNQFIDKWQYLFSNRSTILKLNQDNELVGLNISHKNLSVNLPFEQTEKFYDAFTCFFDYLKNPAYQYHFRLEPGDCILAQNFRVLHGRKAFDPSSGIRHLKTSYIAWDYFRAKHNFNQFRSKLRTDEFDGNRTHDYYTL